MLNKISIMITSVFTDTEKDITSTTFKLSKDDVTEDGFDSFTGNIGTIDPWTFIPTRDHSFEVVSCSANCPGLNTRVKVEGEKYGGNFDYLLEKMRESPKDYLHKSINVFSYSPMTGRQCVSSMPSWCNAKIVFKAYCRKRNQYSGSYFSNVYFDLIRNDGHVHHCIFGFSLDSDGVVNHVGEITLGEDQDNTYLIDDLPELFVPNFKIFNPEKGVIEKWGRDILERIVSNVDGKLLERKKREGISIFDPLKLTEEDCNLTYFCEIHPKESNHSHRHDPEYYITNYNNACK